MSLGILKFPQKIFLSMCRWCKNNNFGVRKSWAWIPALSCSCVALGKLPKLSEPVRQRSENYFGGLREISLSFHVRDPSRGLAHTQWIVSCSLCSVFLCYRCARSQFCGCLPSRNMKGYCNSMGQNHFCHFFFNSGQVELPGSLSIFSSYPSELMINWLYISPSIFF